jgi:hypothetical protein
VSAVRGTVMALTISESAFLDAVVTLAHYRHWLVYHPLAALRVDESHTTPVQGDAGFPDLVLARDGLVLFRELKRQHEQLMPNQVMWQRGLGGLWELWRPSDWPRIQEVLR